MIQFLKKLSTKINAVNERLFQWELVKLGLATFAVFSLVNKMNDSSPLIHLIVVTTGVTVVNLFFAKPYVMKKKYQESIREDDQLSKKPESNLLKLHKAMYQAHDFKFLLAILTLSYFMWQIDFFDHAFLNGLVKLMIYVVAFMLFRKPGSQKNQS
ncbi:hypothetical protein AAK938_09150 [Aerococcaceae bacterium 50-4]